METVYERHQAAFRWITAAALCTEGGVLVGFVTMQEDPRVSPTVRAWVHLTGTEMVEGAAEWGASKSPGTAAVRDAISRLKPYGSREYETPESEYGQELVALYHKLKAAGEDMGGGELWFQVLARHDFRLHHAL